MNFAKFIGWVSGIGEVFSIDCSSKWRTRTEGVCSSNELAAILIALVLKCFTLEYAA